MAKQRRRRGHIQLRSNGTFRAYVYAGRDPITKKKRYLSETVQTYDQAEKALTRLLAQVERERSPTTSGTVGYLLSRWLEVADLELTTRDGYGGYTRRNILPTCGASRCASWTTRRWIASTPTSGLTEAAAALLGSDPTRPPAAERRRALPAHGQRRRGRPRT